MGRKVHAASGAATAVFRLLMITATMLWGRQMKKVRSATTSMTQIHAGRRRKVHAASGAAMAVFRFLMIIPLATARHWRQRKVCSVTTSETQIHAGRRRKVHAASGAATAVFRLLMITAT